MSDVPKGFALDELPPGFVLDQPKSGATNTPGRIASQSVLGLRDAAATTLGAPTDAAVWLMNRPAWAINTAAEYLGYKPPVPPISDPILGSESIKRGMDYVTTLPGRVSDAVSQRSVMPFGETRTTDTPPATPTEKFARGAGEGAGNALAMVTGAGAIANATRGVNALGPRVARALATQPVVQTVGGALGGGVTAETGNPIYGTIASLAYPLGYQALLKSGRVGNALIEPFRQSGRDRIVGSALNEMADDPRTAMNSMEAYTPPVPGFQLSAAKASRDDALMATENALNKPGSGLGLQANQNNAVLSAALDRLAAGGDPRAFVAELARQDAGAAMRAQAALDALPPNANAAQAGQAIQAALRGRYDELITARSNAADPLYNAARASTQPVNPWELMTSTADTVAATKDAPRALMERVRGLLFNPDGTPDRTSRGMMATRTAVTGMLESPTLTNYERSLLVDVLNGIDNALAVVPEEMQARAAFRQHSVPLAPFDPALGNRNVAATIKQHRPSGDFLTQPENVPSLFVRPGEGGGASMREFTATNPAEGARTAMYSYIGGRARESGDIGGFSDRYAGSINALNPRLAGSLNEAATTNQLAAGYRASPAGRFVTGDTDAAIKSTLGAPDSQNRMLSLRGAVAGNDPATAGLQRGIIDDFRASASSKAAEDQVGNPRLMTSGAERWLQANRTTAASVLTPDQMAGLEAITRALKDQSRGAAKVAGSDTGRNLATQSIVDAILVGGAGDTAVFRQLRTALGIIYSGANVKTADRLAEVMLDPRVAAALMRNATPQNVQASLDALRQMGVTAAAAARAGSAVDTNRSGGQ